MSSIERRVNARTGEVSWRVRYRHNGSNMAVTFDSDEAAQLWRSRLDVLGHDAARRLLGEEKPKVTRTVTEQIRHHVEHLTNVTDGTRRRYRDVIRTHLDVAPLNSILLGDLTRDHVRQWVNAQQGAPKSIRNRHALLSAALSSALDDGLIERNVAKGIKLPRLDTARESVTFLTWEEFGDVLCELDPFWRPVPMLLVGTGVRWGEATALMVQDVDLSRGDARIRQAWQETGGSSYVLGPPKTSKSRRTVRISESACEAIAPLLRGRSRDDFVLTNRQGAPLRDWWRDRIWKPAVSRSLGRNVRVHDLRHTYAAWAIQDGVQLAVIQRQLGHESIQTTVDTYGHLVRSDFDALGESIDARLRLALARGSTVRGEVLR